MRSWRPWAAAAASFGLLCACGSQTAAGSEKLDFNFEVRPVLAEHCFKCHGPDVRARKAKLRLDLPESAYAVRDPATGKRAIMPGHPEKSELYRRITAADAEERMPPAASKLSLTAAEKQLLREWIVQGAEYRPHWAFIPVKDVPVPKPVGGTASMRNPIDAFVFMKR